MKFNFGDQPSSSTNVARKKFDLGSAASTPKGTEKDSFGLGKGHIPAATPKVGLGAMDKLDLSKLNQVQEAEED
jgi:hypothetical protein